MTSKRKAGESFAASVKPVRDLGAERRGDAIFNAAQAKEDGPVRGELAGLPVVGHWAVGARDDVQEDASSHR